MKKPISSFSMRTDNSLFSAASSATAIAPLIMTRANAHAPASAPAGLVHVPTKLHLALMRMHMHEYARAPTAQQLIDLCGCDIMQDVKHCWSNEEKVFAIDFDQVHRDPELLSQQLRCTCTRSDPACMRH
jgi:hypothetical protein